MKAIITRSWNSPTLMTWMSFAARSGSLLLVTPLVLTSFSPAETALWFFFLTLATLQMMADFGFGPSFIRAIAYATAGRRSLDSDRDLLAGPNEVLLGEIHHALQRCYRRLTLAGILLGLTLGTWATWKPVSELSSPVEGWQAWALVLASSAVIFRNSAFGIWLQGNNQVALLRRTETILSLAVTTFTALVLWFTRDFLASIASAQLGAVAASWGVRLLAKSRCPGPEHGLGVETDAVFAFIWPAAWRSGVGVLMSSAAIQASGIIYAQVAPPEKAAPYLLAMRIMQMILQISMAPFYSKIPWFAALYGAGNRAELIPAVQRAMGRCHWVFALGVLGVNFVLPLLLHGIGSKTAFVPATLWMTIGLAYLVERIGAMHMQFYSLSNHILWHVANGISGAIYLVISFALLPLVGAMAFPLGMICGYAGFYTWFSIYLSCGHYKISPGKFEIRTSITPALILILVAVKDCVP